MADTDTGKPTPIGDNAVRAIEELRAARGLSLRQLTERLGASGHTMHTSAVHSLTQGKRRIDADDLMAFALALGVNTNALLLPRHVAANDPIELAPHVRRPASSAWGWADGKITLAGPMDERFTLTELAADFARHARPDFTVREPDPALREVFTLAAKLEAVQAAPDSWEQYRDGLVRSYRLLGIVLEELIAEHDKAAGVAFDTISAQVRIADAADQADRATATNPIAKYYGTKSDPPRRNPGHGRVTDPFGERGK